MNKMAMAALGLGAAYLMRNKNARGKLMKQFESFTGTFSKNGTQNDSKYTLIQNDDKSFSVQLKK